MRILTWPSRSSRSTCSRHLECIRTQSRFSMRKTRVILKGSVFIDTDEHDLLVPVKFIVLSDGVHASPNTLQFTTFTAKDQVHTLPITLTNTGKNPTVVKARSGLSKPNTRFFVSLYPFRRSVLRNRFHLNMAKQTSPFNLAKRKSEFWQLMSLCILSLFLQLEIDFSCRRHDAV
jgi:hypothetical protein